MSGPDYYGLRNRGCGVDKIARRLVFILFYFYFYFFFNILRRMGKPCYIVGLFTYLVLKIG